MIKLKILVIAAIMTIFQFSYALAWNNDINLKTLLLEMTDRNRLTEFPDPYYRSLQFSSYDPRSTTPDNQSRWFANRDCSNYLRVEDNGNGNEWVMMDAEGPGAVARIWSANPKGKIRIYLDRNPEPVIEAPMADLLDGKWKIKAPLASERSRGHNLYLPIPYNIHCKITSDSDGFYYIVNYRSYEKGTSVQTLTPKFLDQHSSLIAETNRALIAEGEFPSKSCMPESNKILDEPTCYIRHKNTVIQAQRVEIEPGGAFSMELPDGSRTVNQLAFSFLTDRDPTRSLVLVGEFDGEQTVWCPFTDFFGAGAGAKKLKDFFRIFESGPHKEWCCFWRMPYKDSAVIGLKNFSDKPVKVVVACSTELIEWKSESMHFYGRWRSENSIPTRPMRDWNFLEVQGKGVFVGDTLSVINPVPTWWGEGDEKIYVDHEKFPSHFGTGTEDYYGYAWCCNALFEAPFHSQPRCDGEKHGNNWGHTTVSRLRSLDAIPFKKSFKFDMEVWHWKACEIGYSAATFFYAFPGAIHNRIPQPDIAAAPIPTPTPLPLPFKIKGVLECEEMKIVSKSPDLQLEAQGMKSYGANKFSNDTQLWVRGRRLGDYVELAIPVETDGKFKLILYATRSWDYGIIRFFINKKKAGKDLDLFNAFAHEVAATGPINLGVFEVQDKKMILKAEVVGGHPRSEGSKSFFGLDCIKLIPVR